MTSNADYVMTSAPAKAAHLRYRSDIDGLRTIAVLPVVLNHAGFPGFRGGYVGVDIFFVISGFLITSLLVKDIAEGQYSIGDFYRRRALRILPALLAMLAVASLVFGVVLLPGELVSYAKSLGATGLFSSNFLFWNETGYFARASAAKPLLHTWSLAIEEQFYILWPLVLAFVGRRVNAQRWLTVLVLVASFALSILMLNSEPTSAFFLLPSRAWELAVGACLAVFPPLRLPRWLDEMLGLLALLAIAFAIKFYSSETPFPGPTALVPCVGAAVLIATGTAERITIARSLLNLRPMIWIGRISYSLYLWHWPVIVFCTLALFLQSSVKLAVVQVVVSILLAWFSWYFVEQPFRVRRPEFTIVRVLSAAVLSIIACVVVAGGVIAEHGFPGRLTPGQQRISRFQGMDGDALYRGGICFQVGEEATFQPERCLSRTKPGAPVLLFMGDSHSAHLWPGFSTLVPQWNLMQADRTGCKPVVVDRPLTPCTYFFDGIFDRLPTLRPDHLILSARWIPSDAAALRKTLADPRVLAAHPIVVGPVPQYTTELPRLLVAADARHDPNLPGRHLDPEVAVAERAIRAVAKDANVPYVSLMDLLCVRAEQCRYWAAPDEPLQFDYGHLTAGGSRIVAAAVLNTVHKK